MDFTLEPAVKAAIKRHRAHAYALELADGATGERARKNADLICRAHWRKQLEKTESRRHTKARTFRRILQKEGAI